MMPKLITNIALSVTILVVSFFCGCSSGIRSAGNDPTAVEQSLPTVTELASLTREASVPSPEMMLGSAVTWHSGNSFVAGSVLAMPPSAGPAPAWGIFEIQTSDRKVLSIEVEAGAAEGNIYFALANFDTRTWDYRPPGTVVDIYSLGVTDENIGGSDEMYVAVVAPVGANASVAQVTVIYDEPGWVLYTLDDRPNAGAFLEVFVQNNRPMLAFVADNFGGVNYYRSTVDFPTSPDQWVQMIAAGGPDPEVITGPLHACSIDGRPAVVYKEDNDEILRYAYSTVPEPDETADWVSTDVYDCSQVSLQVSLVELDSCPSILFSSATFNPRFAKASDSTPTGPGDWAESRISTSAEEASYGWMTVSDGIPVVMCNASIDDTRGAYYYRASSTSPAGPEDWTSSLCFNLLSFAGAYPRVISQPVIPGTNQPVAAFLDDFAGQRLYLCVSDVAEPSGQIDWSYFYIDNHVTRNDLCSVGGRPFVLYCNDDEERLKATWATQPVPTTVDHFLYSVIADCNSVFYSCTDNQGIPVIAFRNEDTGELIFGFYDE